LCEANGSPQQQGSTALPESRTLMASVAHNSRPSRESVSKRIGSKATAWIWKRDKACCAYCGEKLTPGRGAHLDHLTPANHGGEDLVINLVLACESCNSARQDLTLTQWAAYAARARGLKVSPKAILARALTPVPAAFAGKGRAWQGAPLAA
jgi:hypothetical protein